MGIYGLGPAEPGVRPSGTEQARITLCEENPLWVKLRETSCWSGRFVELVDTLVDEFDVVDLLTLLTDRCMEVLEVAAVGLMLVVPEGGLQVVASSSDAV